MPSAHLYGGPAAGKTVSLAELLPLLTVAYANPEPLTLWEVTPVSSRTLQARYVLSFAVDARGRHHLRYVHEDLLRV